jgi:hypothetical protein
MNDLLEIMNVQKLLINDLVETIHDVAETIHDLPEVTRVQKLLIHDLVEAIHDVAEVIHDLAHITSDLSGFGRGTPNVFVVCEEITHPSKGTTDAFGTSLSGFKEPSAPPRSLRIGEAESALRAQLDSAVIPRPGQEPGKAITSFRALDDDTVVHIRVCATQLVPLEFGQHAVGVRTFEMSDEEK